MSLLIHDETELNLFSKGLYLEHLADSSFLAEQRLVLLESSRGDWIDFDDFEQRFEAHIDGLVVGEDLALAVCMQQAIEGDFGEFHAAVRVFCRQKRLIMVGEVLEKLDPEDKERVQAVGDALNHELPREWEGEFIRKLSADNQRHISIIAKLLGYRRLNAGEALLQALEKSSVALPTIIWSLGRLREKQARTVLFNKYLQMQDEAAQSAAALALLRIGEPQTVSYCTRVAKSQTWSHLALGLGGSRSTVSALREIASSPQASREGLIALGLLGDVSAIETLLPQLANPELAEHAARALDLITSAEINEEVFIPEEIDEDELFEEEKEKLKRGESLTPPGERPPGTNITRLSQKPEEWKAWWSQNKSRFNPQIRYRSGKPYSPACLLENLESEKSARQVRQLAYEELVIRYGIDFPFETDMFVVQQKQALAKYAEWIKTNGNRFSPGKWYFAGQMIA